MKAHQPKKWEIPFSNFKAHLLKLHPRILLTYNKWNESDPKSLPYQSLVFWRSDKKVLYEVDIKYNVARFFEI